MFKKLISSSCQLEDQKRAPSANFKWNFDWILAEYFRDVLEEKNPPAFLVSSCSLLRASTLRSVHLPVGGFLVCCYGNQSQVRPVTEALSWVSKNILFPSVWLSSLGNPHFLGNLFFVAWHWWMDGQREHRTFHQDAPDRMDYRLGFGGISVRIRLFVSTWVFLRTG